MAGGVLALTGGRFAAQEARTAEARIEILLDEPIGRIAPEIYGHFVEHLGGVVYDGIWVGEDSKVPNVGGVRQAIVEAIRHSGAALLFVGLGCPRQEVWAYEYRETLPMPLIAVGAAFDFHAGLARQAPPWMQRSGLEWLYRLAHEPMRLWKRYVLLNPGYLALLALQAIGLKRFDPKQATPPTQEVGYG